MLFLNSSSGMDEKEGGCGKKPLKDDEQKQRDDEP